MPRCRFSLSCRYFSGTILCMNLHGGRMCVKSMNDRQQQEKFFYWKRPRAKWFCLAGGILELLVLWRNIREYNRIAAAGIFSPAAWTDYAEGQIHLCVSNGIAASLLLGSFLIGNLAQSQRSARRAEGLLLLFLALVAGIALCLSSTDVSVVFWVVVMLACLGGAACSFGKHRK